MSLSIVFIGLSITSSWGNGHATTYRGLLRELASRGHDITFLERDVPWYADHRDLRRPPYCRAVLYRRPEALRAHAALIRKADVVVIGSYVPDGVAVAQWVQSIRSGVTCFYDIDTPVTLAKLARGDHEYLSPGIIPGFDIYFSFTGGPTLDLLERQYGARAALPLYCSVDPESYYPENSGPSWDLGYLGTYSSDRQPKLESLLIDPARQWDGGRFAVAGPLYPDDIAWPANVERIDHLPPSEHRAFYTRQRFTLNITRADMVAAGWSPSVRLFEAAACATPVISDPWPGIDEILEPGKEVLLARTAHEALAIIRELPEEERRSLGKAARRRVMRSHTAAHRATEFETGVERALGRYKGKPPTRPRMTPTTVPATASETS